jgi:hypothetical protein
MMHAGLPVPEKRVGKRPPPRLKECPILADQGEILSAAAELTRLVRRLKRHRALCQQCEGLDNCQVLSNLSSIITSAIQEVADEWNLVG